jgi:hypothetical protein
MLRPGSACFGNSNPDPHRSERLDPDQNSGAVVCGGSKMEPWRAEDVHNGGIEAPIGTAVVDSHQSEKSDPVSRIKVSTGSRVRIRIDVKRRILIYIRSMVIRIPQHCKKSGEKYKCSKVRYFYLAPLLTWAVFEIAKLISLNVNFCTISAKN